MSWGGSCTKSPLRPALYPTARSDRCDRFPSPRVEGDLDPERPIYLSP
jgi:hypothetical protein